MSGDQATVTFDEADIAWARDLVEAAIYPSVEAAIRGELSEARERRDTERRLMLEEVKRRLETAPEEFIRVESDTYFTDRTGLRR
jgi:Arc/MetJ-type ribon-helix-helix transcriptional regulator